MPLETSDLVTNPFAPLEDRADPKVPTATLQIYDFIHNHLKNDGNTTINRASSASLCWKRRWFQRKNTPGEPLTPRKQVNFLLGNLSECVMLYFIKHACVGEGKLYSQVDFGKVIGSIQFQGKMFDLYEQETLETKVGNINVSGHADGFGKRNSDGKWELIECKSAANYGFQDFQTTGPKDYLKQSAVLMKSDKAQSLQIKEVRFFYLRKESGHLWDRVFPFDERLWVDVQDDYAAAMHPADIPGPYFPINETVRGKPTGRLKLPFPCRGYCPYTVHCHGETEIDWRPDQWGHSKPVFLIKQIKTNEGESHEVPGTGRRRKTFCKT